MSGKAVNKTYRLAVVKVHIGIARPFPETRPGSTAISRTEELRVRPPTVQAGYHNRARALHIDTDTAKAEVEITT